MAKEEEGGARIGAPIKDKMSKTRMVRHIAEEAGLAQMHVESVLDALDEIMLRHLMPSGAGEFTLPGLLKIKVVERAATPQRTGRNPATGEAIEIAAKPAGKRLRLTALKRLKDTVE